MKRIAPESLRPEPVSHDPDIPKDVWLRKGEVPHLLQFARTTIPPHRVLHAHAHPDATEVYLVTAGLLRIRINGALHELAPGGCLVIEPGEVHAVETGPEPVSLTYFMLES